MEFYIDGNLNGTFTSPEVDAPLYHQELFYSGPIGMGDHTLVSALISHSIQVIRP